MRILYLDLDSTRPDHLGCYGYHRPTSPTIDAIAREGVRFTNCYTSDAPCLPSRTALFYGRFGIHTGVVGHGGTTARVRYPGDGHVTEPDALPWALALSEHGMHTVSFTSFAHRHLAWFFAAGWAELHRPSLKRGNEIASEINQGVLPWLRQHGAGDDWFLHVNYWDPHMPYRTPSDYGNPFADSPPLTWLTEEILAEQWDAYGAMSARDRSRPAPWGMSPTDDTWFPRVPRQMRTIADVTAWFDGYDVGLHYTDRHIAQLIELLEQLGVLDETIIIVSADHGENQGELNIYGDHQTADHWTNRVPLIVRWPGVTQPGSVVDAHVYQQDLPPGVLELLGCDIPASWDGISLAPALRGEPFDPRPFLVFGQGAWTCQRAVRFGPWLSIRTLHPGLQPFPAVMLFDLDGDPHQTTNLAPERPDIVSEADGLLTTWWYDMMTTSSGPDPLLTVAEEGGPYYVRARWTDFLEGLRRDGQAWAADALAGRSTGVRPDRTARQQFGGQHPAASSS